MNPQERTSPVQIQSQPCVERRLDKSLPIAFEPIDIREQDAHQTGF